MSRKEISKLHQTNELVGGIHDGLLDSNLGLAEAFDDACVWIAELHLQLQKAERGVSAGYVRTDTSKFVRPPKYIPQPVDNGDSWVNLGG
jgi:hypothetical protein